MNAASPNPYLAWLDGRADPPFPGDSTTAAAAETVLRRRVLRELRRFGKSTPAAAALCFEAWARAWDRHDQLGNWMSLTAKFRPKSEWPEWEAQTERAIFLGERLAARLGEPRYRTKMAACLRVKTLSAPLRCMLRQRLECAPADPKTTARLRLLTRQQEARERRHAARLRRAPGLHVRTKAALIHVEDQWLKQAREIARQRGHGRGYVFLPGTDGSACVQAFATDPALRRAAWAQEQSTSSQTAHVETARSARFEAAHARGFGCWMAGVIDRCAVGSVERTERLLASAVDAMRAPSRVLRRAQVERARRRTREDLDLSWDTAHLEHLAPINVTPSLPNEVFPWEETVRRALPELLAIGGWSVEGVVETAHKGRHPLLRFNLVHPQRGQAQLWYTPSDPCFDIKQCYAAAFASCIRTGWDNPSARRLVWISQSVSMGTGSFTLWHLIKLAHEVAHAMHYLSLEGVTQGENVTVPEDTIELPSYLLELYPRDPLVLARWASLPQARRPSYWRRHLQWSSDDVLELQDHAHDAWMDNLLHRYSPEDLPLDKAYEQLLKQGGVPVAPEGTAARAQRGFVWDEGYAGLDGSHVMGKALVHRLVTHRTDGQVRASDIAALWSDMANRVLSGATSPERWRQRWRSWLGESTAASVAQGIRAMGRHHRRLAHLARARLLPPRR